MPARLRQKTRSCPSSATYSSIMSGTFRFWTRPKRRSSGRTNSKLYVDEVIVGGKGGADNVAAVVPRVLCEQRHFIFRRPTGGDQEAKAGPQSREASRAHDGLWYSNRIRLRREDTLCRNGDRRPSSRREGSHHECTERALDQWLGRQRGRRQNDIGEETSPLPHTCRESVST